MHLKYLLDPANAITAIGLAISILGIQFAIVGRLELAVAAIIWVFFLDHVDGFVARRSHNRRKGAAQVGRHLDSITDFSGTCILPAIVLINLNEHSTISIVTAVALVLVGGLRVAYYEAFSSQGGCFVGVPAIYNAPVTAMVFMLSPFVSTALLGVLLNAALAILIVLQLTTLRVPLTYGWMYPALAAFTVITSGALVSWSI